MPGTYSHTTRADGSILTASIYNADHQNHITFATPGGLDDYSTNVAQMQSAVDPGETGTESLPTDFAGEIQRLRFAVAELKAFIDPAITYWYQTPTTASVLLKTLADAKGDLLVGTADNTIARMAVGADGSIPMARSAATPGIAYVLPFLKHISGLTWANDGADAVNDLQINPGVAMDGGGTYLMRTIASMIKQSDNAWAVGSDAGGLDTGVVGNNDYYIWMIARSDTGVVDYLYSLSSTAPTMPANYDFKRVIGWFKRSGGTIVAFRTYETAGGGIEFQWTAPTLDINHAGVVTNSLRTDAVKVPLNFSTVAHLNVAASDATAQGIRICCPDHDDSAVSLTAGALANQYINTSSAGEHHIRTSSTGTIAIKSQTNAIDTFTVSTVGFVWSRR